MEKLSPEELHSFAVKSRSLENWNDYFIYLTAAANAGSVDAAKQLQWDYIEGRNYRQDIRTTMAFYKKTRDRGYSLYVLGVGYIILRKPDKAVACFERACNFNNPLALHALADRWYEERYNIPRAIEMYKRAAEGGSILAIHDLGNIYESGIGVDKDIGISVDYHIRAAGMSYAPSRLKLLNMYRASSSSSTPPPDLSASVLGSVTRNIPHDVRKRILDYFLHQSDDAHAIELICGGDDCLIEKLRSVKHVIKKIKELHEYTAKVKNIIVLSPKNN